MMPPFFIFSLFEPVKDITVGLIIGCVHFLHTLVIMLYLHLISAPLQFLCKETPQLFVSSPTALITSGFQV